MARSHRGGCHDRSAQRPFAILVFGRVRYRACDCGRDHTDLMWATGDRWDSAASCWLSVRPV